MLKIQVSKQDYFDEETNKFISPEVTTIELEHSLVSISKWESIWEKPFISKDDKTEEELYSYIECMVLDPELPPETLKLLSLRDVKKISEYINAKMTATWFSETKKGSTSSETITSELIYYWMVALSIDFECQYWHLARLLTLIEVCNRKNSPQKKLTASQIAERNRALNAKRRAELGTPG